MNLEGKKTVLAALLLAVYGVAKAFAPGRTPDLPAGWEETALGVLFLALRLVTRGPVTLRPGTKETP